MRFIMIIAAMLLAVPAQATDLAPWQKEAARKVLEYKRITKAQWTSGEHLVVWSKDTNIAWNNVVDQHICLMLLSQIKKPKGTSFVVNVWHDPSNKFMGIGRCNN